MTTIRDEAMMSNGRVEAHPTDPDSDRPACPDGVDPRTYVRDTTWVSEPMTIRRTIRLVRSDYQRMADHYGFPLTVGRALQMTILPAIIALVLYRVSSLSYERGFRTLAWFLYSFNNFATGCDILPRTRIGERCLLGHTTSTILSGQIGRNATILARGGVGGAHRHSDGDIGAGLGLPVLGDDVILGANSSVMGAIFIGDGAFIGAHSMVIQDVPPNAIVSGSPARVRRSRATLPVDPGEGPRPLEYTKRIAT
jgi:serine acetyltransferase